MDKPTALALPYPAHAGTVDVVIPMYNAANTIVATLNSVLAQTRLPSRIVVVNDGSTDGCEHMVRGLRHPLIDVIDMPHKGVSHARNTGIAASRAEFIAFLDSDDLWEPHKLETQMTVAARHPDAALVTCGSICVDVHGAVLPGTRHVPAARGDVFDRLLRENLEARTISSTGLVRRPALLAIEGYDERLHFGEDTDLLLRLARRYPLDFCPDILVRIVENPGSTTRTAKTADEKVEILVQHLMVLETWVEDGGRIVVPWAAQYILTRLARNQLGFPRLGYLTEQMRQRTPGLARRLAPDRRALIANLLAHGLLGALPLTQRAWRFAKRRWRVRHTTDLPATSRTVARAASHVTGDC